MVAVGWWPAQGHVRRRRRLAQIRHTGSVLHFGRHFGWIAPDAAIDHPEAWKHNWRVYVNLKDVSSGEPLWGGARVSFFAYCDGDGIGAEEVLLEDGEADVEMSGAKSEEKKPNVFLRPTARRPAAAGKGGAGGGPAAPGVRRTIEKPQVNGATVVPAKGKPNGKGRGKDVAKRPISLTAGPGGGPDRSQTSDADSGAVLSWAASELRGWRPAMEDAHCAILGLAAPLESHALFGVFDGHGGAAVSRRAADDLPGEVAAAAAADAGDSGAKPGAADDGGIAGRALKTALLSLDAAIRESGADRPGFLPASSGGGPIPSDVRNAYALMGSTAICALLECDGPPKVGRPVRVVVANIGDSRAMLCRGGACVELSEDHKPDDAIEKERIEKAGGFVAAVGPCQRIDGWGLNLSRALGDFHYKAREDLPPGEQKVSVVPDIRSSEVTEEDEFLLLACDGVFELHSSQEAVEHVRQRLLEGESAQEAVRSLVDASCSPDLIHTQGKGSDNVSAMVVMLR